MASTQPSWYESTQPAIMKALGRTSEPPQQPKDFASVVKRSLERKDCAITGNEGDVQRTEIHTPLKHPVFKNDPFTIHMDVSREGLVKIIETLLEKSNASSMTTREMVTAIQDLYLSPCGYYASFEPYPEYRIGKDIGTLQEKDLFCPFCKHTMEDHPLEGLVDDVERSVHCTKCECNDILHPGLIVLKDKAVFSTQ